MKLNRLENDDILEITPSELPFNRDDKIFVYTDEYGNIVGDNYSYNDWINQIKNMSGINQDLMGKYEAKSP